MGTDLAQLVHTHLSVREVRPGESFPESADAFLKQLGGPTLLLIPGEDPSRVRAISTLLHANEPSGFIAIHRWLRSSPRPPVTVAAVIAQVGAALHAPGFAWRSLPGEPDLNRCFKEPFDGPTGGLARAILDALEHLNPEALVDIHNTSARGPAYAVLTREKPERLSLTSLFCELVVVTHIEMGTLINATESLWPSVVIETGGPQDPAAHELALRGLERFVSLPDVLELEAEVPPRVLRHPVRVLLKPGVEIRYDDMPSEVGELTLRTNVFELNYAPTPAGTELGWVGTEGLGALIATDDDGIDRVDDLFAVDDGRLRTRRSIHFFMVTTHPEIAQQDCLFYAVSLD